jgi:hypothetical protein
MEWRPYIGDARWQHSPVAPMMAKSPEMPGEVGGQARFSADANSHQAQSDQTHSTMRLVPVTASKQHRAAMLRIDAHHVSAAAVPW